MSDRDLRCPSCDGAMRPVERRGVVIDLCRECKGVFLDRGELDKLLDAAAEAAPIPTPAAPPTYPEPERRYDRDDRDDRGRDRWSDDRDRDWERERSGRRRKRGGFLDDLFDFD